MAKCVKCKDFFPLGFVTEEQNGKCIFCHKGVNYLPYKEGNVSKEEIIKEYKYYLNKQKEKNDKIRNGKFDPYPHIIKAS